MTPSDLQQPILLSVLGAGLATAFLHAALPTHWLPFVLVGRALWPALQRRDDAGALRPPYKWSHIHPSRFAP